MERPTALSNFFLLLKTIACVLVLEGVLDWFSHVHYRNLFRRFVVLSLGRDPARPAMPDDWDEWYNS